MKFLKILLLIVVSLAVLFFVIGAFLPSKWEIAQSRTIQATPAQLYSKVANLKRWQEWSPWKDAELNMVSTYSGPEEGAGAQWNWTSEKMGSGSLRITEADLSHGIQYDLFIDMNGSQSTLKGQIDFEPQEQQTLVTWSDRGDADGVVAKWKALLIGFMMKKQMTQGLEQLDILK